MTLLSKIIKGHRKNSNSKSLHSIKDHLAGSRISNGINHRDRFISQHNSNSYGTACHLESQANLKSKTNSIFSGLHQCTNNIECVQEST